MTVGSETATAEVISAPRELVPVFSVTAAARTPREGTISKFKSFILSDYLCMNCRGETVDNWQTVGKEIHQPDRLIWCFKLGRQRTDDMRVHSLQNKMDK